MTKLLPKSAPTGAGIVKKDLLVAMDAKSQQVAQGQAFARGEPLKVLHTSALNVGV
jgi:hypothetical protein